MDPSTGTFLSMDSYEGSIYDPDSLHKYLYANANPVKYSDPGGNMASLADSAIATSISNIINCVQIVHLNSLMAGTVNMAIASMSGVQGTDLIQSFYDGYMTGLGTSALLYFTAAISVKAFAIAWFGMSVASVASSIVFIIAALQDKNSKLALVGGALLLTSIGMLAGSVGLTCDVFASGSRGAAEFTLDFTDPDNAVISKGGSNSPISLKQALKNLDKSGVRPGQTEIHTSQLNNVINEIQNNYNPSKAYSSIYSDGANRYIVEGHHTTVAFEMLGKDSAINMNTATSDLPSSTNIYWSKKWYQFWRKTRSSALWVDGSIRGLHGEGCVVA